MHSPTGLEAVLKLLSIQNNPYWLVKVSNWRIIFFLRVLKRLGFVPPCVRRASYFRANLSEDYYSPSRVLQDWKQERYFHSYSLDYHLEGIWISTQIYSHLSTSKTLIFNIWFISTVYNRQIKSLNWL
jgi:hypothetical protein